jgi:hypothetical protein
MPLNSITRQDLDFDQLMEIYNHIGEEERHFNTLEVEYRKLASQWLLVSLGVIGFILTKPELVPINVWVLVIGVCIAATIGILVLWMLDLKVYHELLHSAFKEGVKLEDEFPQLLPQIRNNMVNSLEGGDIIKKVILYYFFSILLLILVANIAIWMYSGKQILLCVALNCCSAIILGLIYAAMTKKSVRHFTKQSNNS